MASLSLLSPVPRLSPACPAEVAALWVWPRHTACRRFSLAEFTQEQARARREKLRLRLKEEKLEALRWKFAESGVPETEASLPLTVDAIDDASVEEDLAVAMAGGRLEEMTFLQPYPARRRRALLRAAGVRRIDREERRELQALRQSREDCGCRCDRVCDPETCSCSLAGIKCQMDHTAFPCGCCREGCENPKGRVESIRPGCRLTSCTRLPACSWSRG